jgi:D-inositol-3-phosphate glycosyltransferase
MRIAMISYHTSPLAPLGGKHSGGMNVYVRELSAEMGRQGHQVDIFTRGVEASEQELGRGARLITIKAGPANEIDIRDLPKYIDEFAQGILDFARTQDVEFDLIHAHYWMSGLAGRQLKATWNVPMVLMFHTLGLVKNRIAALGEKESAERIRGERIAMAAADYVVAATPAERADLQWLYELHSDKVRVIPPGVDLERFKPMPKAVARVEIRVPEDSKLVMFVGRLEALKGIDTLIRAVYPLVTAGHRWATKLRVQIIGGDVSETLDVLGTQLDRLRELSRELGVQDQIDFLGSRRQSELPAYYGAADVVVMPSYSESFGMVALEAMACARPVVASRVGGLKYLVRDGETGYHVREGKSEELVARLTELLADKSKLEMMGQVARKEAEQYSWQKAADEILELFGNLLKQPA